MVMVMGKSHHKEVMGEGSLQRGYGRRVAITGVMGNGHYKGICGEGFSRGSWDNFTIGGSRGRIKTAGLWEMDTIAGSGGRVVTL